MATATDAALHAPATPPEMAPYLRPTAIIDSDSEHLLETAARVIEGARDQRDAVKRIFHYVRDDILYGRIPLETKASDVIRKKRGNCTNKSVLLVAMARASGIPARMHYFNITGETIKPLMHPILWPILPDVIPLNARADVFLNDRWITLETELDPELYRGLRAKGLIEPTELEWDGEKSTELFDAGVRGEIGTFVSPEEPIKAFYASLNRAQRAIVPLSWWLSNRWLRKVRRAGQR